MTAARPLLCFLLLLAAAGASGEERTVLSLSPAFAAAGPAPHLSSTSVTETWGRMNPSSITLRSLPEDGQGLIAEVLFDNHLTTGNVDIKAMSLGIEGLVVHVTVVHGMDRRPDRLVVEPPLGFVALPPSLLVEDGTVGAVSIRRLPVG